MGEAELKNGGVVRLRLTFSVPDSQPRAEVFYETAGRAFRTAVIDYVAAYRLPCIAPGDAPVVATQEFEFDPGDGRKVVWAEVRDEAPARGTSMDCLIAAKEPPEYPSSPFGSSDPGVVLARFSFTDPLSPPKTEILFDGGTSRFSRVVGRYAESYRLPCMKAGGPAIVARQVFHFRVDGQGRSMLKDSSMASFAAALDKLESQHVRFDFTTMGCPFEVRFVLYRPYVDNEVGEIERHDPNRREFLEWLKRVELNLPAKNRRQVIGDSMTIAVPCTVLDLR